MEAASSSELSELVGFKVKTLIVLPFEVEYISYITQNGRLKQAS